MYAPFDRRQEHRPPRPTQPGHDPAHGEHREPHREPPRLEKPPQAEKPPEPHREPPQTAAPEKPHGLLESLMEDQEQSLILILLVILMKDGADLNVILALMYLIL